MPLESKNRQNGFWLCNFLAQEYCHKSCLQNDGEIDYRALKFNILRAFFVQKCFEQLLFHHLQFALKCFIAAKSACKIMVKLTAGL